MNKVEERCRKQASDAVKRLNPSFFGLSSHQTHKVTPEPQKPLKNDHRPHSVDFKGEIRPPNDEYKLNKTEKAYLAHLRSKGYDWLGIQNITLKIADDCRLTCDFAYLDQGKLTLVDVKGFQREDAFIKIKVAARLFPLFNFQIVKRVKGGGWDVKEVKV